MKKPENPDTALGDVFYLNKDSKIIDRDSYSVFAPKGMMVRVLAISDGEPMCVFNTQNYGQRFLMRWSLLNKREPTCPTCGHSIVPEEYKQVIK